MLVFAAFFALVGAFAFGFKLSRFLHKRRKSRALRYLREAGVYPPIYSGYPDTERRPTKNSGNDGAPLLDQILYMGIIAAALYAVWCGLT